MDSDSARCDTEPPQGRPVESQPPPSRPVTSQLPPNRPAMTRPPPNRPTMSQPPPNMAAMSQPPPNMTAMPQVPPNRPAMARPPLNRPNMSQPPLNRPAISRPPPNRPIMARPPPNRPTAIVQRPLAAQAPTAFRPRPTSMLFASTPIPSPPPVQATGSPAPIPRNDLATSATSTPRHQTGLAIIKPKPSQTQEPLLHSVKSTEPSTPATQPTRSDTNPAKPEDFEAMDEDEDDESSSDDDDEICAVCMSGEYSPDNLIVFCEGKCKLGFHQRCFGIDKVPPGDEPWYCDWCSGGNRTNFAKNLFCCHYKSDRAARSLNIVGKENEQHYVHIQCAAWNPDIDTSHLPFTTTLRKVKASRSRCLFCDGRFGYQLHCAHVENGEPCQTAFHPMCALRHGFLSPPSAYNAKYDICYCPKHATNADAGSDTALSVECRRVATSHEEELASSLTRRKTLPSYYSSDVRPGSDAKTESVRLSTVQEWPSRRKYRTPRLGARETSSGTQSVSAVRRVGRLPLSLDDEDFSDTSHSESLPHAATSASATPSGRRRGRPPKNPQPTDIDSSSEATTNRRASTSFPAISLQEVREEESIISSGRVKVIPPAQSSVRRELRMRDVSANLPIASKPSSHASSIEQGDQPSSVGPKLKLSLSRAANIAGTSDAQPSVPETTSESAARDAPLPAAKPIAAPPTPSGSAVVPPPTTRPVVAPSPMLESVVTQPSASGSAVVPSPLTGPVAAPSPLIGSVIAQPSSAGSIIAQPVSQSVSGVAQVSPYAAFVKRPNIRIKPFSQTSSMSPTAGVSPTTHSFSAGNRGYVPLISSAGHHARPSQTSALSDDQANMLKKSHSMLQKQNEMLSDICSMIKGLAINPAQKTQEAMSTISSLSALVSNGSTPYMAPRNDIVPPSTFRNPLPTLPRQQGLPPRQIPPQHPYAPPMSPHSQAQFRMPVSGTFPGQPLPQPSHLSHTLHLSQTTAPFKLPITSPLQQEQPRPPPPSDQSMRPPSPPFAELPPLPQANRSYNFKTILPSTGPREIAPWVGAPGPGSSGVKRKRPTQSCDYNGNVNGSLPQASSRYKPAISSPSFSTVNSPASPVDPTRRPYSDATNQLLKEPFDAIPGDVRRPFMRSTCIQAGSTMLDYANPVVDMEMEMDELKENIIYLIQGINMPQILLDMMTPSANPDTANDAKVQAENAQAENEDWKIAFKLLMSELKKMGKLTKYNVADYVGILVDSMQAMKRSKK